MSPSEVIAKAKYIQFPLSRGGYREHNNKEIVRLPEKDDIRYIGMEKNGHHYKYAYAYDYVLPAISKLLDFPYSKSDFKLVSYVYEENGNKFDLSYLRPKRDDKFEVTDFIHGIKYECDKNGLRYNDKVKGMTWVTEYHKGYACPHSCSRIVNKTLKNGRKLMISGDSQMIPSIIPLANYFEEVWYFDNRTEPHKNLASKYKNTNFDSVLFAYYADDSSRYIKNIK